MSIETKNVYSQSQISHRLERFGLWMHEHPTIVKVTKVMSLILGIGLLASLPLTAPILGTGIIVSLAITGGVLTLASSVALFALRLIAPVPHDMKNHAYKPGQCEGGRLYYEGDVPILSLDANNPFKAGKAHGYLCGEAINCLSKRFGLVLHTLARQPRADQLPNTIAAIRRVIPAKYLTEIEGLVEGYNQWSKEQPWWRFPKKLTVDDALLFQLLPDSLHFQPKAFEKGAMPETSREFAIACSAIIDKDPQKGIVFARNMDWPSFEVAGEKSLVINRHYTNGLQNTVEVGIPGFIGTLTGMNKQGLSIAMNVCQGTTTEIRGMPAALYNRACLEQCKDVKEVERFIQHLSPLGAYHLTIADKEQGETIHFYQSPQESHVIRRRENNKPLTTLNCRYNPRPNSSMHYGAERQQMLDEFFKDRKNRPLEEALSLPFVNNSETTHRVLMEPKARTFRVAFDNAYGGTSPLYTVSTEKLLADA